MLQFLLIVMLNISSATRSDQLFVASDSLFSENGIISLGGLDCWRFHPGDDLSWAQPDYDDSDWMFYKPAGLTDPIPDSLWQGYGWFRFRFAVDSSAYAKITQLHFVTWGAAEVYFDGKLLRKYGTFSNDPQGERRYMPYFKTHPAVVFNQSESHVLAVRFSYHKGQQYKKLFGKHKGSFGFWIGLATNDWNQQIISDKNKTSQYVYILGTMLFLIFLLNGFLFVLFPLERSNLYIAIVAFLLFLHIIANHFPLFFELDVLQTVLFSYIPNIVLILAAVALFPLTISSMFNQKPHLIHKLLFWLFPVFALANFILSGPDPNPFIAIVFPSLILFYSYRVLIKAWRNKQRGVWFVAGGFLGLIVSTVVYVFYSKYTQDYKAEIVLVLIYMMYASVPFGLTAFMASRFRDLYINLEQKVKERTRELNQSLENLRSTQSQLIHSEKMASLGALTAGIAHEIQNPLNFVNNFSDVNKELLEELKEELAEGSRQLTAGSRQSVEDKIKLAEEIANDVIGNEQKINHHGKRAESIVKGMLLHSRGSSGHKEPVDINALCDEYLRLSYHGFRAKDKSFNADFKTDFDPNLPQINVVPQDIGRVLLNLINNAFYAVNGVVETLHATSLQTTTPYKPAVMVSTRKNSHGIEITVMDNGPGIPLEIKDKIFQPFFTTKPTGQGTGLGLSLAYDIMKAHGGEIRIKSKEGEGTKFIIYLPLN